MNSSLFNNLATGTASVGVGRGGAVALFDVNATMAGCNFNGNRASFPNLGGRVQIQPFGGAVFLSSTGVFVPTVRLERCAFTSNLVRSSSLVFGHGVPWFL